jgi:hypothetical protein
MSELLLKKRTRGVEKTELLPSKRVHRVFQTQSAPHLKNGAFCGLFSINNAMQKVDFLSIKVRIFEPWWYT